MVKNWQLTIEGNSEDNINFLCDACQQIAAHPYVSRLKNLTQLGLLPKVLSIKKTSRLTHSIGVALLSQTCRIISSTEYSAKVISDETIKCLEIAGLLHDVGHGVFSHFYTHLAKELGILELTYTRTNWGSDCQEDTTTIHPSKGD